KVHSQFDIKLFLFVLLLVSIGFITIIAVKRPNFVGGSNSTHLDVRNHPATQDSFPTYCSDNQEKDIRKSTNANYGHGEELKSIPQVDVSPRKNSRRASFNLANNRRSSIITKENTQSFPNINNCNYSTKDAIDATNQRVNDSNVDSANCKENIESELFFTSEDRTKSSASGSNQESHHESEKSEKSEKHVGKVSRKKNKHNSRSSKSSDRICFIMEEDETIGTSKKANMKKSAIKKGKKSKDKKQDPESAEIYFSGSEAYGSNQEESKLSAAAKFEQVVDKKHVKSSKSKGDKQASKKRGKKSPAKDQDFIICGDDVELELTPVVTCKTPIEFALGQSPTDAFGAISPEDLQFQLLNETGDEKLGIIEKVELLVGGEESIESGEDKDNSNDIGLDVENVQLQHRQAKRSSKLQDLIEMKVGPQEFSEHWQAVSREVDVVGSCSFEVLINKLVRKCNRQQHESTTKHAGKSQENCDQYTIGTPTTLLDYERSKIYLRKYYWKELRKQIYLNDDDSSSFNQSDLSFFLRKQLADYFWMDYNSVDRLIYDKCFDANNCVVYAAKQKRKPNILAIKSLSQSLILNLYDLVKDDKISSLYIDNIKVANNFYIFAMLKILFWYDKANLEHTVDDDKDKICIFTFFIQLAADIDCLISAEMIMELFPLIVSALPFLGQNKYSVLRQNIKLSHDIVDDNWTKIAEKRNHQQSYGKSEQVQSLNSSSKIVPFDYNRVELDPSVDNVSYVNASKLKFWVNLHKYKYIASQAPLKSTRAHFWHMVSQQERLVTLNLAQNCENFDYLAPSRGKRSLRIESDEEGSVLSLKVLKRVRIGEFEIKLIKIGRRFMGEKCKSMQHVQVTSFGWSKNSFPPFKDIKVLLNLLFFPKNALDPFINDDNRAKFDSIAHTIKKAMGEDKMIIHCQ
ncbi:MAG: Tyrosine-protein phosphatase non-receptor type 14, partial [Marteilia pararefringens]